MKTKNVVLGLLAFTIAIGSAFASLTVASEMRVLVYLTEDDFEDGIETCIATGVSCSDSAPGVRCGVKIPLQDNTLPTTDKTYKDNACDQQIFQTSFTDPASSITPVYRLVE